MTIRRTRAELLLASWLRPGLCFRDRATGDIWRVHQLHRKDCEVEMHPAWPMAGGGRICIPFEELRAQWVWIATTTTREAICA